MFKHKTADGRRISDWSSDVCSSDLAERVLQQRLDEQPVVSDRLVRDAEVDRPGLDQAPHLVGGGVLDDGFELRMIACRRGHRCRHQPGGDRGQAGDRDPPRSEEHTSELQSLMRISYAVFCLKKKNKKHVCLLSTYTT